MDRNGLNGSAQSDAARSHAELPSQNGQSEELDVWWSKPEHIVPTLLPLVHAYRDEGPQSKISRWKPRKVFCTDRADHADEPGRLYAVKFVQGKAGAAALISEVICTELLKCAKLPTLEMAIIQASEGFAASCRRKPEIPYSITAGLHFGTLHRSDVESGPPLAYDDVASPIDLIRLWVFDTWVGNIDRGQEGNILLAVTARAKFNVIAADQSDCFCGAKRFCGTDFDSALRRQGPAASVSFLPQAIFDNGGPSSIRRAVSEVQQCSASLDKALLLVPSSWWRCRKSIPLGSEEH